MRNYFEGSYGLDRFSRVILITGVLFLITRSYIPALILISYGVWRILSRNVEARRREEIVFDETMARMSYKFNQFFHSKGLKSWSIKRKLKELKDRRYYVIVTCPKCNQKLRLPKNKGNIIVTCKRCSSEFRMRT